MFVIAIISRQRVLIISKKKKFELQKQIRSTYIYLHNFGSETCIMNNY